MNVAERGEGSVGEGLYRGDVADVGLHAECAYARRLAHLRGGVRRAFTADVREDDVRPLPRESKFQAKPDARCLLL